MSTTLFLSVTRHLRTEFSSRFSDIPSPENGIRLFSTPFDVQVDATPEKYQMKLIELQCSNKIKSKFHFELDCLTFMKNILNPNDIPTLLNMSKNDIHLWQHLCV